MKHAFLRHPSSSVSSDPGPLNSLPTVEADIRSGANGEMWLTDNGPRVAPPLAGIKMTADFLSQFDSWYQQTAFSTEDGGNAADLNTFSYAGAQGGYAFGLFQFDAHTNPNALAFLSASGEFTSSQLAELKNGGTLTSAETITLNGELQAYLESSSGSTAMANLISTTQSGYYDTIDNLLSNASPDIAGVLYSDPVALQHISDYINQFPAPFSSLQSFLQGNQVNQPGGSSVQWTSSLSGDDNMKAYFYSTMWAHNSPTAADTRENAFYSAIAGEEITPSQLYVTSNVTINNLRGDGITISSNATLNAGGSAGSDTFNLSSGSVVNEGANSINTYNCGSSSADITGPTSATCTGSILGLGGGGLSGTLAAGTTVNLTSSGDSLYMSGGSSVTVAPNQSDTFSCGTSTQTVTAGSTSATGTCSATGQFNTSMNNGDDILQSGTTTLAGSNNTLTLDNSSADAVDNGINLTVDDGSGVKGGSLTLGAGNVTFTDDAGGLTINEANGITGGKVLLGANNLALTDDANGLILADGTNASGGNITLGASGLTVTDEAANLAISDGAHVSGDTIDMLANLTAVVSGPGDILKAASNDVITLSSNGLGDNVSLGTGDILDNVTGSYNGYIPGVTVNLAANGSFTLEGNTHDIVDLTGRDTVNASNELDFFTGGAADVLLGGGNTIIESANGTITGSNDIFQDNFGSTNYNGLIDAIIGNNDSYKQSSSDTLLLSGLADTVSGAAGDLLALTAGSSSATVTTAGEAIDLNYNGDNATGSYDKFGIFGNQDSVSGYDDTISLSGSQTANVTGGADQINEYLGDVVGLTGTNDTVNGYSNDGLILGASSSASITNAGENVSFWGGNDTVTGSGDSFNWNGFGGPLTGASETVSGSSDGGTLATGDILYDTGSKDLFTVSNADTVTFNGDTSGQDGVYVGSGVFATAIFNGGGSQEQIFNPNSTTADQILDYTAANATGTLQDKSWLYDNNTSASDIYDPNVKNVSEEDFTYATPDAIFASGNTTLSNGTTIALADDFYKAILDISDGTSQVQYNDYTGNSLPTGTMFEYNDYASVGGTGAEKDTTSDIIGKNGDYSVSTEYNPQADVASVTGTFSGINDTGTLESDVFTDTITGKPLTYDDNFSYSGTTLLDVTQNVYTATGVHVGDAEFNSQGQLVENYLGNYKTYQDSNLYGYYAYGTSVPQGGGGGNISAIGAQGRQTHGFLSASGGKASLPRKHLAAPLEKLAHAAIEAGQASAPPTPQNAAAASTLNLLVQAMAAAPGQPLSQATPEPWQRQEALHTLLAAAPL